MFRVIDIDTPLLLREVCTQFTNVNGNEFYGVEFCDRHFQTKSKLECYPWIY